MHPRNRAGRASPSSLAARAGASTSSETSTKASEANAAKRAALRAVADQAEQRKEDALERARAVVEFTEYEDDEADRAVTALAEATEGEVTPAAVEAVSTATGEPRAETARKLTTGEADSKAYQLWMASKNISNADPSNPDHIATVTLGIVERRRRKLENKVAGRGAVKPNAEHRAEYEKELDELEEMERLAWTQLHPILIGPVFGSDVNYDAKPDPNAVMRVYECHYCTAELDPHRAFDNPVCATCQKAAELASAGRTTS